MKNRTKFLPEQEPDINDLSFKIQDQLNKLAGGRHDMPPPSPLPGAPIRRRSALRRRADDNVVAVSHGQHVPTPTAAAA